MNGSNFKVSEKLFCEHVDHRLVAQKTYAFLSVLNLRFFERRHSLPLAHYLTQTYRSFKSKLPCVTAGGNYPHCSVQILNFSFKCTHFLKNEFLLKMCKHSPMYTFSSVHIQLSSMVKYSSSNKTECLNFTEQNFCFSLSDCTIEYFLKSSFPGMKCFKKHRIQKESSNH